MHEALNADCIYQHSDDTCASSKLERRRHNVFAVMQAIRAQVTETDIYDCTKGAQEQLVGALLDYAVQQLSKHTTTPQPK